MLKGKCYVIKSKVFPQGIIKRNYAELSRHKNMHIHN